MEQVSLTKATYRASSEHLYSEVGDEAVILNLQSGVYYGLNETGVSIWQWLQKPKQFSELLQLLVGEYEVDPKQCELDLQNILQQMTEVGILERSSSS